MKTYFGYIRVSTPRQGLGVSLDEQRAAIMAFAEKRGLVITEWFVETETAAKQGRTEFTKMIKALRSGKANGVIIHKIDRSARNMKDWASLGELIDQGVDVQFAHESLDLHSRGGRLAADIQAVVAADYIRNLRDEVMKGFYGRLKQGCYPLPAPVGYLDRGAGNPKEIDPIMGPLVRYAYERYAREDIGLRRLRDEMKSRGLRTNRGNSLSISGLATMLHNPFYLGLIRIKRRGETFQGAHEPLVTKEVFDRVQNVLQGKHIPMAKRHTFLYRGLIHHIGCTRCLTGEIAKGRFIYYRCHGLNCRGVCVPEPVLDATVETKMERLAVSPEDMQDLRDLMDEADAKRKSDAAKDKASLKLRIERCNERLARLTDALVDGVLSKEVYDARNAGLLAERRGLEDRLAALDGEAEWYRLYKKFELENHQILSYKMLTEDEKRDLLRNICSNFGYDGKNPVITLKSPYFEIEKTASFAYGGTLRTEVRTKEQIDMVSNSRVRQLFEMFCSLKFVAAPDEHIYA